MGRKVYDVVGYAIDGAAYCLECVQPSDCECRKDDHGMCLENCDGYGPNPIFLSDADGMSCDGCFKELDE